ncbi:MAG TPA: hypothetical protein VFI31_02350 [Pirellulales bacterium]|nr:hypothetical protein [Pirellulales bacterium]
MKTGDIAAGAGRLQDSVKSIKLRWEETKDVWNDVRRAEFDVTYMEPIEPQVRMTLEKLRKLSGVFHQACQECKDSNQ